MSVEDTLNRNLDLTQFEQSELSKYDKIYTVGEIRINKQKEVCDKEGFYDAKIGEQIGYRYKVLSVIETGVFGRVLKCLDEKEGIEVAVKLSKNTREEQHYALHESNLLKKIQIRSDDPNKNGIVKMLDSFTFH